MYREQTPVQEQIERAATQGRGFWVNITGEIPFDLQETEIGLQLVLLNMDYRDRRVSSDSAMDEGLIVKKLIEKIKKAKLPLDMITTADGLRNAIRPLRPGRSYNPEETLDLEDLVWAAREQRERGYILTPRRKSSRRPYFPSSLSLKGEDFLRDIVPITQRSSFQKR